MNTPMTFLPPTSDLAIRVGCVEIADVILSTDIGVGSFSAAGPKTNDESAAGGSLSTDRTLYTLSVINRS